MATVPNSSRSTTPRRPRSTTGASTARRSAGSRQTSNMLISFDLPFDKTMLFGIVGGIVVIALGFFLMSTAISSDPANNDGIWNNAAAVTIAPIVLTIGYCVIVPWAIASRRRSKDEEKASNPTTAA